MSETLGPLDIVLSNSKTYEDIQERRTQGFTDIERALDIVRAFIIRKKRILYGGMSIDISLRLADKPGIYTDDAIPDYDFYSPDIEGDANEIADILHAAGFTGVNAHNAQHATTRRVKINLANNVADVSYMPAEIYDRIPTQMYKGMRVTHPIFQWMDMHRSLSQPFEKPPWEVITHRVHKDIKRYKLLYEAYGIPLQAPGRKGQQLGGANTTLNVKLSKLSNMSGIDGEIMLGGYQVYGFLYTCMQLMIGEGSVIRDVLRDAGTLSSIQKLVDGCASVECTTSDGTISWSFPTECVGNSRFVVISDDFPSIADRISKNTGNVDRTYYDMYGDYLRPRTIILAGGVDSSGIQYEIFDNLGHTQPGYKLDEITGVMRKINSRAKKMMSGSVGSGVWVCGPQNMVLYALQKYHDYNTPKEEKEYHLFAYQSGIWLIEAAEMIINTLRNSDIKKFGIDDLYKNLPFFLTTQSYGKENWSADYLSLMYHKTYMVLGVPGSEQRKTRPPYSYTPGNTETSESEKFDLESSPIFQMSGKKVKGPFTITSTDPDKM
jgi:hypothetical protein